MRILRSLDLPRGKTDNMFPVGAERCPSGLRSTLGKRVYRKVPQVRILSSPLSSGYAKKFYNHHFFSAVWSSD